MSLNFVPGVQLAQSLNLSTLGPHMLYSATLHTEVTRIIVANVGGTPQKFRLFHDDDGSVYSTNSALYYDVSVGTGVSVVLVDSGVPGSGITVSKNGTLGFTTDKTAAFCVTVYGITQQAR